MRVCNLSLDKNILQSGSPVQRRLISLAEKAGAIVLLVPAERDKKIRLSEHLTVYSVGGWKLKQFFKMWRVGNRILSGIQPPPHTLLGKGGGVKAFDLITVQDTAFLALLGYCLGRRFGVPLEVQVHGLEQFYGVRKLIAGFVLHRADRVRAVSERLKLFLTSRFQLPAGNLYVLPVYTQIFPPLSRQCLPRKAARVNRKFTFLTVGRLVTVKNVGLQIRAFGRLAKEFPDARLVVVGDGPERSSLQLTTDNLQLGGQVTFEGRRENLELYYREADAFLLTSHAEGWGLVVTEAAAYGLPIVMTDVGLAGEFIRNGENGLVVPVGDEDALVLAMRQIVADAPLRQRLGVSACRSFEALPSPEEQGRAQVEHWGHFV